jgi:hypothetical protein
MTTEMHIASKGKHAGEFVVCGAKKKCRNGGQHLTREEVAIIKANYGVADKKTHAKYLKDRLNGKTFVVPAKRRVAMPKTENYVEPGTVPVITDQKKFTGFLEENGVRATYSPREFKDGRYVESDEKQDLYNVETLEDFNDMLANSTSYGTAPTAEKVSIKVLSTMEEDAKKFDVSSANLKRLAEIAATRNNTAETTKRFQTCLNILEDLNYHTYNAYLTALYNRNTSTNKVH